MDVDVDSNDDIDLDVDVDARINVDVDFAWTSEGPGEKTNLEVLSNSERTWQLLYVQRSRI